MRVIEYTLADPGRRTSTDRYRLVTTILDPGMAPPVSWRRCTPSGGGRDRAGRAEDHPARPQAGATLPLPELVAQEVWAHLLVHYALRAVMHTAALAEDLDPDRLSFVRTLRVIRRQVIAAPAFSP